MKIAGILILFLFSFVPSIAQAAPRPSRIDRQAWFVGATLRPTEDRACFGTVSGTDFNSLACANPTAVVADQFMLEGRTIRVLAPTGLTRGAFARVTLTDDADVRAIVCDTTDGLELCSTPSAEAYSLDVLMVPAAPALIDLEEVQQGLSRMREGIEQIQRATDAAVPQGG